MRSVIVALVVLVACTKGEHRDARDKYNEGVELLVKGDHEAAEKALLDARSTAGVDPELRFRAAYDLGMAYAAHAEKLKTGKEPDLNKALELTEQAVSWFSDAARLRKDDADTKANLAIVRARAQSLADELRKGEGKLEARLDAVIADQRSVLDESRGAWIAIKQAGGTDPLAQQSTLTHLADKERGIVAEAGVIGDLADSEIDEIAKKTEDKRTDEEKVRLIVLKNLDVYLGEARGKIAEARRKLQDLAAEDAVDRAEAALVALKRAREQLLDPIKVLSEIAQDEMQLLQETSAVAEVESGKLTAAKPGETPIIPSWMNGPALALRQLGMHSRLEEVRARLAAAVEGPPPAPPQGANPQQVEEQKKLLERVKVALPFVVEASTAMDTAHSKLLDKKMQDAAVAERDAIVAIAKAIEQFADLKQTIDHASETQKQIVSLLTEKKNAADTKDGITANAARMTRIKELLADEVAKLDQQAQQPADPKADPKQVEAQKQQIEQMKQQMAEAEKLRGEAEKLIGDTDTAIKANKDPLTPAKAADAKLDELRRIFFSVIEHLQDLIRQQGETRDQTSTAHSQTDEERAPKLPGIATRQDQHGQLAKAITDALAAQADAAAKAQDPNAQQQAKNMSAAADEVRLAQNDMADAKHQLDKAASPQTQQSVSLEPSLKSQASAIEHLTNALKLLQPPQQQKQDDKQQQDQQKQDQQKQQQQQPQQGGAGQRARDDDARRQKERREREQSQGDAVEQDW
ncbi:MAG TPA: hypothetical protein VL326_30115 [Kofleriaceae bacterium]|nr:hypothetical protein [Kofleriaceae bacterium]